MVSFTCEEMKNQNNHHHQHHLHSLHKSSVSKTTKKPPPTTLTPATTGPQQPKVYKVKPIHFRELVQKLTGVQVNTQHQPQLQTQTQSQTQTRRSNLKSIAPPSLPIHPHQLQLRHGTQFSNVEEKVPKVEQVEMGAPVEQKSWTDTELTLSPNFQSWFSFALLSPGPATVSQFEQKTVV